MYLRLALASLLVISAPLQARDYHVEKILIEQPTARPTRPGQPSAGAYLNLHNNGSTEDSLISASTAVAAKTEIHTMSMTNNVMRMREVDSIPLAPGAKVVMRPGNGYHVMLLNLKNPLKAGDSFPLTLRFAKAGEVEVNVEVSDAVGAVGAPTDGHGKDHGKHNNAHKH